MVKPAGWVVDMRHYNDEDTGDLPEVIPERVLSLASFFGAIVAWVTERSDTISAMSSLPPSVNASSNP